MTAVLVCLEWLMTSNTILLIWTLFFFIFGLLFKIIRS